MSPVLGSKVLAVERCANLLLRGVIDGLLLPVSRDGVLPLGLQLVDEGLPRAENARGLLIPLGPTIAFLQ